MWKARQKSGDICDECEIHLSVREITNKRHGADAWYRTPATLKNESELMKCILCDESILLAMHLGHIVPRDHILEALSHAREEEVVGLLI